MISVKQTIYVFLLFFTLWNVNLADVPGQNKAYSKAKSEIINSTKNINTYGALEASKLMLNNIHKFEQLKLKVYQAENVDDVIDDVADGLFEIAKTYKEVTSKRDSILLEHGKSLKTISSTDEETIGFSIRNNNDLIMKLDSEISILLSKMEDEFNKNKKRKLEIDINSKKSIINSLKAKNKVWNNFRSAQQKLLKKLKSNSEVIDLFLFALDKNADVYEEAADVAMLRKTAKSMLSQLTLLNATDDLVKDIENNWLEINDLMNEISKSDFMIK